MSAWGNACGLVRSTETPRLGGSGVRIGVLGGTFDPPHRGHLHAAKAAIERLGLDRLLIIPAAAQPLKAMAPGAGGSHRLAMTRLLAAEVPGATADPVELDRGGLSFTVDTLRSLRARWPDPSVEFVLILGEDAAAAFSRWKDADVIRRMARVAVVARGGGVAAGQELPEGLELLEAPRVDVAATEIRERLRKGESVASLVTEPVAAYIAAHGLYR